MFIVVYENLLKYHNLLKTPGNILTVNAIQVVPGGRIVTGILLFHVMCDHRRSYRVVDRGKVDFHEYLCMPRLFWIRYFVQWVGILLAWIGFGF